jgi:signal transduction histidine kinase
MKNAIFELVSTRSIGRDILLGLMPIVVIVALLVGAINYFILTDREIRILHDEADQIAENLARDAARAYYFENNRMMESARDEYQKVLNVVSVSIFDELRNILYEGKDVQGRHIVAKKPIIAFYNTRIGSVEVAYSMNRVQKWQREFLIYVIAVICCLVLAISIASIVLLEVIVRKPLLAFMDSVRAIAAGSYGHRLPAMKDPCMNMIAQSVNTMTDRIATREQDLKRLVSTLEGQAVEREEAKQKLRSLTNELLFAEEKERRRIASEIHDRVGHTLTSVSLKVGLLGETDGRTDKGVVLKEIRQTIASSVKEVQSMIFEISPPVLYDLGVRAAVEWLIEQTSKEHELDIVLNGDDALEPISNNLRVLIFRAVRELLFNVVKHAQANHVEVSITRKVGRLVISVQDDGVGMSAGVASAPLGAEGFGLFSIKERLGYYSGDLIVHSKPHQGTRVVMVIPAA